MVSEPEDRAADDADEFDPGIGAEFVDHGDEGVADEVVEAPGYDVDPQQRKTRSACQHLDARREEAWLREQLSDWDDWDSDAEPH